MGGVGLGLEMEAECVEDGWDRRMGQKRMRQTDETDGWEKRKTDGTNAFSRAAVAS